MARRNPGISPILSARGFGARVLWPKYTPSGGVNSGSEIPSAPSNSLQSNNSNLIEFVSNPLGLNEEIEPGIVFEPSFSDSALDNPTRHRSQMSGAQRAKKQLAKGRRAFVAKHGSLDAPRESRFDRGYTDFEGRKLRPVMGRREQEREFQAGLAMAFDASLSNPFSGPHQEAFYAMARHNPSEKFEVTTKRGKTVSMSRRQIEKMGKAMLAPGEVERVLGRENPKRRYVATEMGGYGYMGGGEDDIGIDTAHGVRKVSGKKQLRKLEREYGNQEAAQKLRPGERAYAVSYFDQYDRRGASTLMTGRPGKVRREAKKAYGKDLEEISEIKPGQMMSTWSNPGPDGRYTPDELAALKVKAVAMLERGVPHADVRKQLDLTYPKYMAVLRSGVPKRAAATHVPDSPSHFLRMPIDERKNKRKQAISMLKAGQKHEDVRKALNVGYKTYVGILRTIPNPHQYAGYHELMSNPSAQGAVIPQGHMSDDQLYILNTRIKSMLNSGYDHAAVREQLGLSYPLYMKALKHGRKGVKYSEQTAMDRHGAEERLGMSRSLMQATLGPRRRRNPFGG